MSVLKNASFCCIDIDCICDEIDDGSDDACNASRSRACFTVINDVARSGFFECIDVLVMLLMYLLRSHAVRVM